MLSSCQTFALYPISYRKVRFYVNLLSFYRVIIQFSLYLQRYYISGII